MKRPWMPLHIPDFLSDTAHLSAAERGAYIGLIMDYWLHDGLPDDDAKLAAIARVSSKTWCQIRPTIQAFFHDGWSHKRIDIEIGKMVTTSARRQVAGQKGGERSSMNRELGKQLLERDRSRATANTAANAQQTSSWAAANTVAKKQPGCSTLHKDITTTSFGAARARDLAPAETTANSVQDQAAGQEPPASAPQGLAEKAREAVQKNTDLGSGELAAVMHAKGWVR